MSDIHSCNHITTVNPICMYLHLSARTYVLLYPPLYVGLISMCVHVCAHLCLFVCVSAGMHVIICKQLDMGIIISLIDI